MYGESGAGSPPVTAHVGPGKEDVRIAPSNAADVLESLIAKALELHADSLEIEYKDGQEEVCAMRGCVGVGIASLDSSCESAGALRQRIRKIGKKGLNLTLDGKTYKLKVGVYDSFGEEAYRIEIGSPNKPSEGTRWRAPINGDVG